MSFFGGFVDELMKLAKGDMGSSAPPSSVPAPVAAHPIPEKPTYPDFGHGKKLRSQASSR